MLNDAVTLHAEIRRADAKALSVRYRVMNRGSTPVFLANRISTRSSLARADTYYLVPRSDGVVEIGKRFYQPVDCPVDLVSLPPRPFMSRVAAGESFEEEFSVGAPFEVKHPYGSGLTTQYLAPMPTPPNRFVLCVGLVPNEVADPRPVVESGNTVYEPSDFRLNDQEDLCSGVFEV